jgi:hypothetical protein
VTRRVPVLLLSLGLSAGLLCGGEQSAPQVTAEPSGAKADTPGPVPVTASAAPKTSGDSSAALAPFEVRLANAKSVKVMESVLGVNLGTKIERAHQLLDRLSAADHPPKEEGGDKEAESNQEREEHKVLWQLAATDFSAVFVKANEHDAIVYMQAIVRPGKEIPFARIGELKKAPVHNSALTAWDVVRPKQPLFRVVAQGSDEKAKTVTWFLVKRPGD